MELKGVNHYGFNINDNNGMLTTIWGPNSGNEKNSLTMDFPTIVLRMKLLGFNAVRLPFSFQVSNLDMHRSTYTCIVVEPMILTMTAGRLVGILLQWGQRDFLY